MKHLYVGIDLHSNNNYIAVIDQEGNIKFKQKLQNNLNTVIKTLKPFKRYTQQVAVESTFNWYWIVDGLQAQGYNVQLANPAAMVQYKGLKHTDDKTDAVWLAEMLRLKILPTGHIYPCGQRSLRDLLRKRIQLVRHRTSLMISLKAMLNNWTGESISRSWIRDIRPVEIQNMLDDPMNQTAAMSLRDINEQLTKKIEDIETLVRTHCKLKKEYKNLLTVWGIGPLLANLIMLETGDIKRFNTVGNYASYCRCVPSQKLSNNKKKGVGNTKNGNKYLAWAYIEAAEYMQRYHKQAKAWFQRKTAKTNALIARKALSNKIAKACYFILRDQTVFNPSKLFG